MLESRGLDALLKTGTGQPGITPTMNARQDDSGVSGYSVPHDIGKPPQNRSPVPSVPLGIRERGFTDAVNELVNRLPELSAETCLLTFVPVLDRRQVELRRSTENDACFQLRRFSRRPLTSGHGLWSSGWASKSASRESRSARSPGVTGMSSCERVSHSAPMSWSRSLGLSLRASSSRSVLMSAVYARQPPHQPESGSSKV